MTTRIPVKAIFDGSNVTALGEFVSGDSISTTYTDAKITSVAGQTGDISNAQLQAAVSGTGVLTTANVTEVTNLYFTNARSRAAISVSGDGSYDPGTGVITINATDLSSYATTTYVGTAISDLVAAAPSTLDTLNELAAALGNDNNFASSTATLIGAARDRANTAYLAATASFDSGNTISLSSAAGFDKANTAYVAATAAFSYANTIDAGNISGNTLKSTVINSSLTSLGTITDLTATAANISSARITGTNASTSKTSGALTVAGGVGIAGDVNIGTSLTVDNGNYGNVIITQFGSLYSTANGPNPYSLLQVRSNDGTTGAGIQAYAGINSKIYSNSGFIFTTGATIRDRDYPTGGTTRATLDSTGLSVTGNIVPTGNVNGVSALYTGELSAGTIQSAGNVNVAAGLVTGNFTAGNLQTTGNINASSGLFTGPTTFGGNVTITGNLSVVGNITSFSSNIVEIQDPMIYLGVNNTGDVVDIGLVAHVYSPDYQHTGFVRDASDGVWKLFANVATEPTSNTLDFTNAIYSPIRIGALTSTTGSFSGNVTLGNVSTTRTIATYSDVGTVQSGTWNGSSISTSYTDAKVVSVNGLTGVVTGLATTADLTTANVAEVTNLYYSNARVYANVAEAGYAGIGDVLALAIALG